MFISASCSVKVCSLSHLQSHPWTNAVPTQLLLFLAKIISLWHDLMNNVGRKSAKKEQSMLKLEQLTMSLEIVNVEREGYSEMFEITRQVYMYKLVSNCSSLVIQHHCSHPRLLCTCSANWMRHLKFINGGYLDCMLLTLICFSEAFTYLEIFFWCRILLGLERF